MKKALLFATLGVVLLIGAVSDTPAINQDFNSVLQDTPAQAGDVTSRYYSPQQNQINPNCENACSGNDVCQSGAGPSGESLCSEVHTDNATKGRLGYNGYLENAFNYSNAPEGTCFSAVWDAETDAGGSNHAGYYAWTASPVNVGQQSDVWAADCNGTKNSQTCVGQPNAGNTNGGSDDNTPIGDLAPRGGLTAIPVPKPNGAVSGGSIPLAWNAVTPLGGCSGAEGQAQYDVLAVTRDGGDCSAPNSGEYGFVKTVGGTSTDVTAAELGIAGDNDDTVFFAIQIRYPQTADATQVLSTNLSANSACFGFSGFAVSVVDIVVKPIGGTSVEVDWRTELEDGVRGFYVTRGFTAQGPFQRVSGLIPAAGEPSAYSFVDQIDPNSVTPGSTGVFYNIEALDIDDELTVFGPASLTLPSGGGQRPVQVRPGSGGRPIRQR